MIKVLIVDDEPLVRAGILTRLERIVNSFDVIEEAARGRGKKDSSNGHWLVVGTSLQIPEATETDGEQ